MNTDRPFACPICHERLTLNRVMVLEKDYTIDPHSGIAYTTNIRRNGDAALLTCATCQLDWTLAELGCTFQDERLVRTHPRHPDPPYSRL